MALPYRKRGEDERKPSRRTTLHTERRRPNMLPLRAILHPTDFSDRSQYAFELACRLARDSEARLIVLHVVQPPPFITHGEMEKALQQAEGYRRELHDKLHNLRSPDPDVKMEYRLE